jgi:hypothetical protein
MNAINQTDHSDIKELYTSSSNVPRDRERILEQGGKPRRECKTSGVTSMEKSRNTNNQF